MYLLDVNVLIALGDANHVHGDAAVRFFEEVAVPAGWATCPIAENAFLRILGRPVYVNGPDSVEGARGLLTRLTAAPGHRLWPDEPSLLDIKTFPSLPASHRCRPARLGGVPAGSFRDLRPQHRSALVPGGPSACFLVS